MDSILTSIKKLLGIAEEYDHFDPDIIMHINTVFSVLTQLGVGPPSGFSITDKTAVWSDYEKSDSRLEMLKSYMYLKVKLLFDPPLGTASIEAINRQISELEWRINVTADAFIDSDEKEYYKELRSIKEAIEILKQHDILSEPLDGEKEENQNE